MSRMTRQESRFLITVSCCEIYVKILKNFLKNLLHLQGVFCYTVRCCDMIAMKREVAARMLQVFRGANVM